MKEKKMMYNISSIVFIVDQIIKIILTKWISQKGIIEIIPKFFSLYYIKNTGAAFSIFQNQQLFLIIISVIILLILHKLIQKETLTKRSSICYGMLIGGIYGNLLDRIIRRGVIDYLSFTFFQYNFPIFNFADCMIVISIIILGITEFATLFRKKGNE